MSEQPSTSSETSNLPTAAEEKGGSLLGHIWASIGATLILGIICCDIYPGVIWAIGQTLFSHQANGSLVKKDGSPTNNDAEAVGSSLLGQNFSAPGYFHPRPSNPSYDATNSGGSNLGPLSAKLIHGATKSVGLTFFASNKGPAAVVAVNGRIQATVDSVTKTSITVVKASAPGSAGKTAYRLDAAIADPATTVAARGRTLHATTLTAGTIVELKLNDKGAVIGINVVDQEMDAPSNAVDTNAKTVTLPPDSSPTVIDASSAVFVVNGKSDAKLGDITPDMSVHAVLSTQMGFDGIADRVIHFCEDNNIPYQSSIATKEFKDDDGIDDSKLIQAFNAAATATSSPTITPATPIPGDAVTASGSGLDPHISPENAKLQAKRVADARHANPQEVLKLIDQYTDGRSLGVLGEPGVNVLLLNLALDSKYPLPAAPH